MFIIPLFIEIIYACTNTANTGWTNNYQKMLITTANSITNVDITTVCPNIDPAKVPGLTPYQYLSSSSCLGYLGPLGPYGPLSQLGPLSNPFWNPYNFFGQIQLPTNLQQLIQWSQYQYGAPMSKDGPLGYKGPLASTQYYGQQDPGKTLFDTNDFAVQLRAFGLWSALGPLGPLGPLGALGPLGPIGDHGYSVDLNGNYVNGTKVVKTVTIDYDGSSTRTYPLYEFYQSYYAKTILLDTSFLVESDVCQSDDTYQIGSLPFNQIVTFVLTPLLGLDSYSLILQDQFGKVIAQSNVDNYIQTIQLNVKMNTKLTIIVHPIYLSTTIGSYRLFVTGSTQYITQYNISGNHILSN
ncbi:unnamed protein product [Paramecium primaurelia]|uniref:Uncharacterized protein n=1 Tax=Paramecium primaurelia TaxID=5886 RepID=A0A8S1JRD7_PARPR|nr:unnamed protein product [Paramecium primaurelia]